MSEVDELMTKATAQLLEHQEWLVAEIEKLPSNVDTDAGKLVLVHQAKHIRLRVVRAEKGVASVVWEYPDELAAFLKHEATPKHLRDTLAGGREVSTEQPASTLELES